MLSEFLVDSLFGGIAARRNSLKEVLFELSTFSVTCCSKC